MKLSRRTYLASMGGALVAGAYGMASGRTWAQSAGLSAPAGIGVPRAGLPYTHPWLTDMVVDATAAGTPPERVPVTEHGYVAGLCGAVERYRRIVEEGGWPAIRTADVLKKDVRGQAVIDLRRRLAMEQGGAAALTATNDPALFDEAVHQALRFFQLRHGLDADGVAGPQTLEAMNVPATVRLAMLVINVERARQWARDYGDRFIAVNIPASRLHLVDGGITMFDSKVIVGRNDRTTPLINSEITRLDFNPYWYVPDSIARRDLLPAMQNDPDYFWHQSIRVFDHWGRGASEIPADTIDWGTYDTLENLPFKLRQDPGPWNVLGPVRYMFDNNHSVYLHGTSDEDLFERATRTFSSGCVRVEHALDIASYLASAEDGWTPERVAQVIDQYKTRSVTLSAPMPIHLIYRTAWVEHDGAVHFRPDVYDWDAVLDITWAHVASVPCVVASPGREPVTHAAQLTAIR